jgi:hypothetical protein
MRQSIIGGYILYVFGSLHIDPKETKELKPLLRKINDTNGTIAIELENEPYTTTALKKFRSLKENEINTILEHQFGKRRIISTYNLLKLVKRYKGINKMVSIEPELKGKIDKLSNNVNTAYAQFDEYLSIAMKDAHNKKTLDGLVHKSFELEAVTAKQVNFRERHMARFVTDIVKQGKGDTLLYASYIHTTIIKEHLRNIGISFIDRKGEHINKLGKECCNLYNLAYTKKYTDLTEHEKLLFARKMIEDYIIWEKPRDITVLQEYEINKLIARRIKSMDDFSDVFVELKQFKQEIRRSL